MGSSGGFVKLSAKHEVHHCNRSKGLCKGISGGNIMGRIQDVNFSRQESKFYQQEKEGIENIKVRALQENDHIMS